MNIYRRSVASTSSRVSNTFHFSLESHDYVYGTWENEVYVGTKMIIEMWK